MRKRDEARGSGRIGRAIGQRLSYANVMATAAVFIALGGTAWALQANSVGTKQLKNNAVTAKKVKKSAVTTAKIKNNAVTAAKLACKGNGPDDVMVRAGSVCIDRYEASIWDAPTGGSQITGALGCNVNGQDCTDIYARSVAGVTPRADITWFQAQQALANSGKRLPTNAEWQTAVAGTPDSATCNVSTGSVANTGANAGCISNHGANDMVGNLWEWVADWDEQADGCDNWSAGFGEDLTCFGDGSDPLNPSRFPGALIRGGVFDNGTDAGPFAVIAGNQPSFSLFTFGFRGAR